MDELQRLSALIAAAPPDPKDVQRRFLLSLLDMLAQLDSWLPGEPNEADLLSEQRKLWLVRQQLRRALLGFGVRPSATVGMPLNLKRHQVVEQRSTSESPPESILAVVTSGYVCNDELLRIARVIIAVSPAESAPATPAETEPPVGERRTRSPP